MRVLLSTYGSRGDVEPLAGLAAELRTLGAEVRVCAPPDAEFEKLLNGVGASLVPIGPSARELVSGVTPGSMDDARRIASALVAMRLGMLEAASECDALLATGLVPAGAREVAERVGIPYVFAAFIPGVLPSPHHAPLPLPGRPFPPGADNRTMWDVHAENMAALYGEPLNAQRAGLGLPPVDDVRAHVYTDHPWLAADPVLAPMPEAPELGVVRTGAWLLPDERPLSEELEAFLDAGEPPVYVGFGSMPVHVLKGAAEAAVEAVRSHGRRLLVSRGWAELGLVDGADDCFLIGETNHRALFGRVAAVVHHGGAGTTTTSARAGAPQVVVPQMADQPYWARRVAELGIGATPEGPPTAESLSAALATALDAETGARARAVAAEVRADGAAAAARLLVDQLR
ncbi:glycosyltransferase [Glycomyces arizonensis]|uniref:glycosyltransferase n=1 Tax=Glycomyces arizonensis TaxID=256035 RepID=UPI00040DB005|nr:glycosyltransferase [Glycomyces arizonensis]